MNTLKKCILLMVLTLNLMPYMQDGNVKWSTMEAGAQLYYTEDTLDPGFIWVCGETAHRYNASLYFVSVGDSCETLTQRPDAEPGEETNEEESGPTTYGKHVCPIKMDNFYVGKDWCGMLVYAVIKCIDPCIVATHYYKNYRPELNIDGCKSNENMKGITRYYLANGISTGPMIYNDAEMIQGMSDNSHALFICLDTHVYIVYQITVSGEKIINGRQFSSDDPVAWDNSFNTAIDYSSTNSLIK